MSPKPTKPETGPDLLAEWGADYLQRFIAVDSQSDERSEAIPSTPGQRELAELLQREAATLGLGATLDDTGNLLVTIPARLPPGARAPALALMVHVDTSEGTQAVPSLHRITAWDGDRVPYPENPRLTVSADRYPELSAFVGDDILHGPGRAPVGLDDKLGMAEVMTLARLLVAEPAIRHGELLLVFRPDEEIGRMEAVEGLADTLRARGVRYGYTVDGIAPFEVNVENFNASRGRVAVPCRPCTFAPGEAVRRIEVEITGVKSHGATAKAEGYLNCTVIFARAAAALRGDPAILPLELTSDPAVEVNGRVVFLVAGRDDAALDAAEARLLGALEAEIAGHRWRGADIALRGRRAVSGEAHDGGRRLATFIETFLTTPGVSPILSEESEGYQGYSNPYAVEPDGDTLAVHVRLRDFEEEGLRRREAHLREACMAVPGPALGVEVIQQYINMGPKMAAYPELVRWAEAAGQATGQPVTRAPIRGGTGVDPFLERDIPVANLGAGYFAPESEKELTSRQNIARHVAWLAALVQVVAGATDPTSEEHTR